MDEWARVRRSAESVLVGWGKPRKRKCTGFPTAPVMARYRCFLPDLAGLAGSRRVGPGTLPSLAEPNLYPFRVRAVAGRIMLRCRGRLCARCRVPRPRRSYAAPRCTRLRMRWPGLRSISFDVFQSFQIAIAVKMRMNTQRPISTGIPQRAENSFHTWSTSRP
jgi:hypothetical protein